MEKFLAPDLDNGFIVNGVGNNNSWVTSIQSVMKIKENRDEKVYYLSQECRNEKVVFLEEEESSSIFSPFLNNSSVGKFLTFSVGDKFYSLVGPDESLVRRYTHLIRECRIPVPSTNDDWRSSVRCEERAAYKVPDHEILESCQNESLNINKIYFRMKTCQEAQSAEEEQAVIYAPVRYLNFSNNPASGQDSKYLQLISGDCLFPLVSKDFPSFGYIAAAKSISENKQLIEVLFTLYKEIENADLEISKASLRYLGMHKRNGFIDFYRYA